MVEKKDLILALYANISRGYNASAQRLVTSIFGWLAFVAFISKGSETQVMSLPIKFIIPIILFCMSIYFWMITCHLGASLRSIENDIVISTTKIKEIIEIIEPPTWKKVDKNIGWAGPKIRGMTIAEWLTLGIIVAIYIIGILYSLL
jgi:succinate dehydrogenase hydrophobic anchor subunit